MWDDRKFLRLLLALAAASSVAARAAEETRVFRTPVTDGISLVTTLSSTSPFLGEQISIVYRIETGVGIAALDVDPQNFDGFWSAVVPVSEVQPGAARGEAKLQELILRQVVAWPLRAGALPLPPLRVKVRLGGRQGAPASWDVVAESRPPTITARPVPQAPGQPLPLVGTVTATLRDPEGGAGAVLELAGTANLSFFDPASWLQAGGAREPRVVLLDADQVPQRQFRDGTLDLTMLQRRRWRVLFGGSPGARAPDRMPGLRVFDPADASWRTIEVGGAGLAAAAVPPEPVESRPRPEKVAPGAPPLAGIFVLLLVAAAAALFAIVRRRKR